MKKKNLIFIVSIILISIAIGLCSSASFAYFNNSSKDPVSIPNLKVNYKEKIAN